MHTSLRTVLALVAIGGLGLAAATQAVNSKCPVKGTPVNPSITANYKGKTVAFC